MQTSDYNLIIIDDEKDVRDSLEQMFSIEGFNVLSFGSAKAALVEINNHFNGVIISDIRMPDMDGLEFLKQIRNLDRLTPVILITGHGDVKLAVESLKLGATDFFEKPFDPKELLSQTKLLHGQRIEISSNFKSSDNSSLKQMTEEFERMRILHSLKKNSGSILSVMKELKLPRRTLNEKMVKYQISRQKFTI